MKTLPKPDISNLTYDPETGIVSRIKAAGNCKAGPLKRRLNSKGYLEISINRTSYKLHRIIFWLMGVDPTGHMVDHRSGVKDDNRWANLRLCDHSTNARNTYAHRAGKMPFMYYSKHYSKWIVEKKHGGRNGNRVCYGSFKIEEEARQCVLDNGLLGDD